MAKAVFYKLLVQVLEFWGVDLQVVGSSLSDNSSVEGNIYTGEDSEELPHIISIIVRDNLQHYANHCVCSIFFLAPLKISWAHITAFNLGRLSSACTCV